MPKQTAAAIEWALTQSVTYTDIGVTITVTRHTPIELVDKVREYFNTNKIAYSTFTYDDLAAYM